MTRRSAFIVVALGVGLACGIRMLTAPSTYVPSTEVPRYVKTVGDYRRSGTVPWWKPSTRPTVRSRWTPDIVLGFLDDYPDYFVDMGIWSSVPTGSVQQREQRRIVNHVQKEGRKRGIDTSRLLFHARSDVFAKRPDGFWDCGGSCAWEGTLEDAPFDPAWIMTVERSEHRWALETIWGGDPSKDPWSTAGRTLWQGYVDRAAIAAVNTDRRVAAVYGPVVERRSARRGREYFPGVSGVVMDLRIPAYRAWAVRKTIADLRASGIDPGEAAAIGLTYKPGWHVRYDGPPSGARCAVEGSRMWTGPQNPCRGLRPTGGPYTRTAYGPGEFETALNALLRELRAGLVAAGNPDVRIVTIERPRFGGETWKILEPDLRSAPWILGEWKTECDRRRPEQPANPMSCRRRPRGRP